ncbi:MAG: hypothetical protein AAFR73_10210 [Pseudomonadota bacterium]
MRPHPDFAEVDWPRQFALDDHILTPLTPEFVDEDFEAVLSTAPLLEGVFGAWPAGLTRADNLIDLAWHEREFTARRSFSWIVRDRAETYCGCFYVFPEIGTRGKASAVLWLCDLPDRLELAQVLKSALSAWLSENLPTGIDIDWTTRPVLD